MNISIELTEEMLKYLDEKESSGVYKSRSEIVRDALRRMMQEDLQLQAGKISPEDFRKAKRKVGEELVKRDFPELA